MFNATHFIVGLIFRAGDQQLIAALPRLTFKIVGDAGIAGVFQIGDHQADRARTAGTQARRHGVGVVVMLTHHRHHFLDGFFADTILPRFAIDDITGRGARHACQARDFIQFHDNSILHGEPRCGRCPQLS